MKYKYIEIPAFLFLITNALFFLVGVQALTKMSYKATIIAILFGAIISYVFLLIYFKIGKNKTLSINNIPAVSCIFLFIILLYSLEKIVKFITYNISSSIIYYFISSSFLLIVCYATSKGFKTIVRSSLIYFFIIIFLGVITLLTLFPKMDFQNVLPIFDTNHISIIKSSLIHTLISITPYFYLSFFNIELSKKTIKDIKKGFIATQIYILIYTLLIISTLGVNLINIYPYPEVVIFKKVSFLNVIDRMESIFSLSYFLSLFTFFASSLYGIINIINRFIKKKRDLPLLICFVLLLINYNISFSLFVISCLILSITSFLTRKTITS